LNDDSILVVRDWKLRCLLRQRMISVAESYPNTNANANTAIASLASTATEATPMASVMIR